MAIIPATTYPKKWYPTRLPTTAIYLQSLLLLATNSLLINFFINIISKSFSIFKQSYIKRNFTISSYPGLSNEFSKT